MVLAHECGEGEERLMILGEPVTAARARNDGSARSAGTGEGGEGEERWF